jgi:SAM-dependent methyltransferase
VEATASAASALATPGADPITRNLYGASEAAAVPEDALRASLGCGNPTALASLEPGMTVLDLGSGGGIDVLLSAQRVGPGGKAYGLDMTDEMLDLARANQRKAGATNVEFLKGTIEEIPLPGASVDLIISNCVINLSADKGRVLREAFRVLRPGGRLAVSDIVLRRALPDAARRSLAMWTGCIAGALVESEYGALLHAAGFADVSITPTRVYKKEDADGFAGSCCGGDSEAAAHLDEVAGAMMSAFIRATKPAV